MGNSNEIKKIQEHTALLLRDLFSTGTLGDMSERALSISEMREIDLFIAQVPWKISLSSGQSSEGLSENMRMAAKDIHAHLMTIQRKHPANTEVHIEIDEDRLPKIPDGIQRKNIGKENRNE